jgi:HlyD family secretion protein
MYAATAPDNRAGCTAQFLRLGVRMTEMDVKERMPATGTSRRGRKRLMWLGAAAVAVLLLALAFRPTPIQVEVGEVARGPLELTIDADGVTRVVDRFQVAAPVTGRLQRIDVREGDPVARGQTIARIAPVPLDPQAISQARSAVAAAEARLEEANVRVVQTRAAMEMAARTADRIRAVVAEGGMSQEALDRAELEATSAEREYSVALSRVRAASSEVAAARAAMVDVDPEGVAGRAVATVASPAAGRVLRVHERSDRVVPAGTPLVDIGDAEGLEVVVDVLSTDAVRIPPNARMRIEDWGGEGGLHARVRLVEPAAFTRVSALGVEEQRVNVIGDLIGAPTALGDGYRVEARIVVWEASDVLKVPASAIFRTTDGWAAFVVEEGRARLREIEIGNRGIAEVEVLGGLTEGDEVVLFPSDQLADGARVSPGG